MTDGREPCHSVGLVDDDAAVLNAIKHGKDSRCRQFIVGGAASASALPDTERRHEADRGIGAVVDRTRT
jgi:hypothetical protein